MENWASDTSLFHRISDAAEILLRAEGNYNARMKRLMPSLRVLTVANFPENLQQDWKLILSLDDISIHELPPALLVSSYGSISPKLRTAWSKAFLRVFRTLIIERSRLINKELR
jgi:hypothetical protein